MDYANKISNLVNTEALQLAPATLADFSLKLERMSTVSDAREFITDFATNNGQDEAFVRRYMQDWNTYYNPKGEETFGLNFNSTSTEEGKLMAQLDQQIFGNEDSENFGKYEYMDTSFRARRFAKHKIRKAVEKWFLDNEGQTEVPPVVMEDIVYEVAQGMQSSFFNPDGTGISKIPALVEQTTQFGFDVEQFGGGN